MSVKFSMKKTIFPFICDKTHFSSIDNEKKTKNKDMTSKRNGGRQLGGGGHLGTKKVSL